MADHWSSCITHFDEEVDAFIVDYFAQDDRVAFVFAGAGFDPRATYVSHALANVMGARVHGLYIREDRGDNNPLLVNAAEANEQTLKAAIPDSSIIPIAIFDEDKAPVGGMRLSSQLQGLELPPGLTDIVLDMSALSNSISFPAARILLAKLKDHPGANFHILVASDPDLDARIVGEPGERAQAIRGYPRNLPGIRPPATIWLPHLAPGRFSTLEKIRNSLGDINKTCPILPFPAQNPRRADDLLADYYQQVAQDWAVDGRDIIYVSEHNPLDSFRSITTLKDRHFATVEGYYEPELVLSPIGSKVMAAGAMMAAIRHNIAVQYVESLRFEIVDSAVAMQSGGSQRLAHVWLEGPIYDGYYSS